MWWVWVSIWAVLAEYILVCLQILAVWYYSAYVRCVENHIEIATSLIDALKTVAHNVGFKVALNVAGVRHSLKRTHDYMEIMCNIWYRINKCYFIAFTIPWSKSRI